MADEFRFYLNNLNIVHDGDEDQQIRIYSAALNVAHDGDPDQQIRIYRVGLELIRDLRDLYSPDFTSDLGTVDPGFNFWVPFTWAPGIGAGDDEVHAGFGFTPAHFTIPDRERNPYPSHIDPQLQEFLEEQQRTVREQHNLTQAGDSTFDYGLLLRGTPNQLYTLGSLGRFYHDRFGLILARYVQFRECVETAAQGAPVGYLATSESVDWVVTNDYTKSNPDFVMGVMCLATTPADGTYGWVVTEGPVPVGMSQIEGILPAPETPYCWHSTGHIEIDVASKILCRRWGHAISPVPAAGTMYVRLEGMSPAWFSELMASALEEINETLDDHGTRLASAESNITNLQTSASLTSQTLTTLTQRIATEEQVRARDIQSVRNLITSGTDWAAAITAEANLVRDEFRIADDTLRGLINLAQYRADEAFARSGGDFAGLQSQVSALNSSMTHITGRLENFTLDWTPAEEQVLVSVNVPNADGNPQWFWQGVDFKLENLFDVDTTTPPDNNDVLTWVAANSKWEPKAPTGGTAAFSGCLLNHNGSTGVNLTAGSVAGNWNTTPIYDTDSYFNSGTPSRLTVPDDGYYIFRSLVRLGNVSASQWVRTHLHIDGAAYVQGGGKITLEVSNTITLDIESTSAPLLLTAGQYGEVWIQVESDTSVDMLSSSWFSIQRVG